jgi:tetratricopeptide (TPR) repeat protein
VIAERARILYKLGRYPLARQELARVLADHPGHAYSHALLALVLAQERSWDDALRSAEEAVRNDPESPFSHYARAYVLRGRGATVPAAHAAMESIRVQADYVHGWHILGQIRLDQRDYQAAARCARQGLAADPDSTSCMLVLAAALVEMGYDEEAGELTAALLRIDPEYSNAHALEGWRLLYRREREAAIAHFQEALRLDPEGTGAGGLRRAQGTDEDPLYRFYHRFHDPLMRRVNRLGPEVRWLPTLVIVFTEIFIGLALFTALCVLIAAIIGT